MEEQTLKLPFVKEAPKKNNSKNRVPKKPTKNMMMSSTLSHTHIVLAKLIIIIYGILSILHSCRIPILCLSSRFQDLFQTYIFTQYIDVYSHMDVSKNRCFSPKSSILIGFSIIIYKPSIWGYPYFWKHPYSYISYQFLEGSFASFPDEQF